MRPQSRAQAADTSASRRRAGRAPRVRPRVRGPRAAPRARARTHPGRDPGDLDTSARRARSSSADRLSAVSTPASIIHVSELTKIFKVPGREAGLRAAAKSLVRRKNREVSAVDGISFDIAPGEGVGLLGPNRGGETTPCRMLSGLLYPSSGEARVLGHVPSRRKRDYLRRMTMVMGNRNQLQWDIPALDSFELNRAISRWRREDFSRCATS